MSNPTAEKMTLSWESYGNCRWHVGCDKSIGGCGVIKEVSREPERSLWECLGCGRRGFYPVGGNGEICVPVEST